MLRQDAVHHRPAVHHHRGNDVRGRLDMLKQHDRISEERKGPSVDKNNGWTNGQSDTTTRTYIAVPMTAAMPFMSPMQNCHTATTCMMDRFRDHDIGETSPEGLASQIKLTMHATVMVSTRYCVRTSGNFRNWVR